MDLSKVPDLELRRKIKPLADKIDDLDDRISGIRDACEDKVRAETGPLRSERDKLNEELEDLLGADRVIVANCNVSGLPIFSDDDAVENFSLAVLVNGGAAR